MLSGTKSDHRVDPGGEGGRQGREENTAIGDRDRNG